MKFRSVFLLLALFSCAVWADSAGRVLVAVGEVTATRQGKVIPLSSGAAVESGDLLSTGPNSNAQVRFADESLVALRASSQLRIDDFKFVSAEQGGSSLMSLLRGGFRTVSGLIGKVSRERYEVRTATSTIGIRGTHYGVVSCQGDCFDSRGAAVPDGTYGGVTEGAIVVRNQAGALDVGNDGFFHVPSAGAPPVPLLAPPSFLADRLEGQSRRQVPGGSQLAGASQGGIAADGRIDQSEALAGSAATAGSPGVVAGEQLASNGNPAALGGGIGLFFGKATASTTNASFERSVDLAAYGLPYAKDAAGLASALMTAAGPVINYNSAAHAYWFSIPASAGVSDTVYIWGDMPASLPTGTVNYALQTSVGAGSWASSMSLNFTSQTVTASAPISIGGYSFTINNLPMAGYTNLYSACSGSGCIAAGFNAGLTGKNGEGYVAGISVTNGASAYSGAGIYAR